MELRATIDGSSHTDDLFFLLYLLHDLLFSFLPFTSIMNDGEGLVPLFTSSILCL